MSIRVLCIAGSLLAGVGLLAGCGSASKPRPDLILVSTRDGDYAIFAMNADGSRRIRLTKDKGDPESPRGLFFQVDPAWSPDGRSIAFASMRNGTFDIHVMNADGTGAHALTSTDDADTHPSWSPNGKELAFARGDEGDIWVVNVDGTHARAVSDDPASETQPSWSPSGNWIAYVRRTPGTSARELWLVRPDGRGRHALTSLSSASNSPTWSPDSRRIAFAGAIDSTTYDLYSIRPDGKGMRRLTRDAEDSFEPSWAPDGQTIAFSRGGAIVTIDLEGNEVALTDGEDNDSSPVWNPRPPQEEVE